MEKKTSLGREREREGERGALKHTHTHTHAQIRVKENERRHFCHKVERERDLRYKKLQSCLL